MGERGHDADWITRWVIRKCYRISKPSPDQIARYRYWHHVSRTVTFDASGPWECWLSREIPPGATVPEPSLPPPPAPPETICSDSEQTPERFLLVRTPNQ
jgi:hypothetical protein